MVCQGRDANLVLCRPAWIDYDVDVSAQDLVIRFGNGSLLPASNLEVLPGQLWHQTIPLAEVASLIPTENYEFVNNEACTEIFNLQNNSGKEEENSKVLCIIFKQGIMLIFTGTLWINNSR